MSQSVPECSKETGNTNQSPTKPKKLNPGKKWVFTLNNYTEEQINKLKSLDRSTVPLLVFQSEIGEKTGTPHLQGVLHFNRKQRPIQYVGIKQIKWLPQRGTDEEACIYASKPETSDGKHAYLRGWKPPEPIKIKDPRDWQLQVIEHLDAEINDREILWFWNEEGNIGKTTICKYVVVQYDNTIFLGGRGIDMKYAIASYVENNGYYPENILINIPKCGSIDYGTLEEIKDGLFFSSKYKSGSVIGNPPRIIVFANTPPDIDLNGRIREIDLNEKGCSTHITPGGSEGSNVLEQINVMNSCCFADWATPRPVAPSVLQLSNTTV